MAALISPQQVFACIPGAQFDATLPHKVQVYVQQPKARFTLFRRGGKVVCMGGKSVVDVQQATHHVVQSLHDMGMLTAQYNTPVIHNICSSGYVGHRIQLQRMAQHPRYEDDCIYECDQYPGLRMRNVSPTNPSLTATLFHSGKLILTGARQEHELIEGYERLMEITSRFKIPGSDTDADGDDIFINTNIASVDPFRLFETKGLLYNHCS